MRRAGLSFPKSLRLRKRREYLIVQRSYYRFVTKHFIVYARPNRSGTTKLGITVSRKVGRAHVRNRVKRWVREAFRLNFDRLPTGMLLVFVARQGRVLEAYGEVETEMLAATTELKRKMEQRSRSRKRQT